MARALYIHWPFCLAKCPYCDFNSHVRDGVDNALWEQSLLADMRREHEVAGGEALESIFFGGGTPSLMPPSLVARLLDEADRLWGFAPGIEITLEGNPSSVESANYRSLAAAGVNRVSLGLQALDDQTLRFLGRLHNTAEALEALSVAQRHFDRVSCDLIYARPGQNLASWQAELGRALSFGTGHLSLYQLTIEPGTRFETMVRKGEFLPLDEDACADLFAPGAHGRRSGFATVRHRKPENWIDAVERAGDGISDTRALDVREQASEAMLMGLRLREGVDLHTMAARFHLDPAELCHVSKAEFYARQGLVWLDNGCLGVTEEGMALLDGLLAELVPAALVAQ
jgi:oxygen-independent coproporphyrinogen-3 oxidase